MPSRPAQHRRRLLVAGVVALAALAGAVAGCSGDASTGSGDPGPVHVHGLGTNPTDGSLYIATHTGLWRMGQGSDDAARVGDNFQDTMGFTVVGPDRFLGSGHPDLRTDLPPLLGLIASSDAGSSWEPVSLLGEADFHALRASGSTVVGYDASSNRLMISTDEGRSWAWSRPSAPLADVAVDPRDSQRLVAAGEAGVVASRNGGRTWSAPGPVAVALAWPEPGALYALAPGGAVSVSRDGGTSWSRVGAVPGEPAAVTAVDRETLIVALHDGGYANSADGGRTWGEGAWS